MKKFLTILLLVSSILFASEEKFSIYEGYEYQGIILELSLKDTIISFIVFKNNKLHRLSIYEDDVVYFKNNDLNYRNKQLFIKKIREISFKEHRKYIFLVTDKLEQ